MIAEPTPQKQKAACSSGEPHKITKAFQRICTKENRNTRKQKVQNFAQWLNWITPLNYADWEGRMVLFGFSEIAFWQKTLLILYINKRHQKNGTEKPRSKSLS